MATFFEAFVNRRYTRTGTLNTATAKSQDGLKKFKLMKHGGEAVVSRFKLAGHRGKARSYGSARLVADAGGVGKSGDYYRWLIEHGEYNSFVPVLVKDLALSEGSEDAEASRAKELVETGADEHGQGISDYLFGNAGRNCGQVSSVSTTTVTFSDPAVAGLYFKDDVFNGSANDGTTAGGTLIGAPLEARVVSTNTEAGTVTFNIDVSSWVVGTYLFRKGDFFPGDPTEIVLGMSDVLPTSVASSSLAGVDRSASSLLSGIRAPGASSAALSLLARLRATFAYGKRVAGWKRGVSGYVAIFSPEDWNTLANQMGVQVERTAGVEGKEGFPSFEVSTVIGMVPCINEASKENGSCFIAPVDFLKIHAPRGELATLFNWDGTIFKRREGTSENELEMRIVSYLAVDYGPIHLYGRFSTL